MGQFDKNSSVISLFRSLINLNQGSFTFKNDEFQFYIHKNDEVMKMRTFFNSNWHTYKKLYFSNFQRPVATLHKSPLYFSDFPYRMIPSYPCSKQQMSQASWLHFSLNACMFLNILSFFQYLHAFVFHINPQSYMCQEWPFLTR